MKRAKLLLISLLVFVGGWAYPTDADADSLFELSLGFSFYRTNYSEESFTWTRRWGASIGYDITSHTEIEFSLQDITTRTNIYGSQDTTFFDVIYSLNVVQSFLPKKYPIQPYVKAGIGQLNRNTDGSYADGSLPPAQVDALTGILGVGMRIFLKRNVALRFEGTTYLTGAAIGTWQDNIATTIGGSILF